MQLGLSKRALLGKFWWVLPDNPGWIDSVKTVHKYVDFFVDRALERQRIQSTETSEVKSEPERYVLLQEMAKQTQDRLDLRSQIIAVFTPGKDTAATLVSHVFYMLARRPDVWRKLRAEVLALGSAALTFEVLKSMKYLQAVLNES